MNIQRQREDHDNLVQFLRDQQALGDPVIYDPIVMLRREMIQIGQGSRIDSFCKLEGGLGMRIGRYVHIASFAHLGIGGGETIIDDFATVASGGKVISGSNQIDAPSCSAVAPLSMMSIVRGRTHIGRFCVIFTNATVLDGVTMHEGSVLAAGAVANCDIPAWEVWGGTPAKFIRKRTIDERFRQWLS